MPSYMQKLQLAELYRVTEFAELGVGLRTLVKKFSPNKTSDFMGLYVIHDEGNPIYVGISRKVINRIRQHVSGINDNDASLAFKMANHLHGVKGKRKSLMADDHFRTKFEQMKTRIRTMSVRFVQVDNDTELYLLEVFAAMKLDTSKWNTFRTH